MKIKRVQCNRLLQARSSRSDYLGVISCGACKTLGLILRRIIAMRYHRHMREFAWIVINFRLGTSRAIIDFAKNTSRREDHICIIYRVYTRNFRYDCNLLNLATDYWRIPGYWTKFAE